LIELVRADLKELLKVQKSNAPQTRSRPEYHFFGHRRPGHVPNTTSLER